MTITLHLVPRVLFHPQIRDRYKPTMRHFNQATWRWEDNSGNLHVLRAASTEDHLMQLHGQRFDKVIMHHFGDYDWCEEFGQDVKREFGGMKVEADPI